MLLCLLPHLSPPLLAGGDAPLRSHLTLPTRAHAGQCAARGRGAGRLRMLAMGDVEVGSKVRVASSAKFFHVPGKKEGLSAKGLTGTVDRVYPAEARNQLDRSDGRDIIVAFDEPKRWKAHFQPAELELLTAEHEEGLDMSEGVQIDVAVRPTADLTATRVEEFMTPIADAVVLTPSMPMAEAAKLLRGNRITGAPVSADGRLVGVLTQFDFLYQAMRDGKSSVEAVELDSGKWQDAIRKSIAGTVSGAMSKPVAVAVGSPMVKVAELMLQRRFNHVPVVDEAGSIQGIVTSQDVLRHVLERVLNVDDEDA